MKDYEMEAEGGLVVRHHYELKVECGGQVATYTDYLEQESFDAWHDSPFNHRSLKGKTYKEIQDKNGKHVIYGVVECFEQSGECPGWYDRETAKYSWRWN